MNCKRIIPSLFLLLLVFLLSTCESTPVNSIPEITRVTEADFADEEKVAVELAEGLELKLWAPGPLLSNAVALTFDQNGVAYVSETARRKSSDLDIRQHRDWMLEDISLESIEDTRAFHMDKLATSKSAENTWQEDFNGDSIHDYRDLMVQTEFVRRIWDEDGDGRADASNLYADGFNDMLAGVAAGVLYHDGEVFVTCAPDVFRMKDTDGDGDIDQKEVISHGYGIHIAYAGHDMSGLVTGPDGKIYWSIGDIGVNVVDQDGKRWKYPNQGAVMRCNPDGSDFEVYAHGLRNPQELAFDAYGNLISVDNDGDHAGEHERYVHIIEGSDSGWRINWQYGKYKKENEGYKVWMDEDLHVPHFPGQAAYLLPPIALAPDGPAGLAYNPGTAMNKDWNGYFFSSSFKASSAKSKVEAFRLEPRGASFDLGRKVDVVSGVVPTGLSFGPDGALYINDWLDGYAKKPQGRIWKLDVKQEIVNPDRESTQAILKLGAKDRPIEELQQLLAHGDMRVRQMAQFELVKRSDSQSLASVAAKGVTEFARFHAIWGLGQLARNRSEVGALILPFVQDQSAEVRAQAAKALGDAKYQPAEKDLLPLLQNKEARVQFFAAEALGKIKSTAAFQPLVGLLEEIEEQDPHLRHAIVFALSRLASADELSNLSQHPSKAVRIGAVVALREQASPLVASFLQDAEPLVVVEAARAIHDDFSIPEALDELAKALERVDIKEEAFVRRAINANLRLGDKESAARLATFINNVAAEPGMRKDALWALGYWSAPPLLDRVDNRYREPSGKHQLREAQLAMAGNFTGLLSGSAADLRAATVTAVGRLQQKTLAPVIFQMFQNQNQPSIVRQAALRSLAKLEAGDLKTALEIALEDRDVELRKVSQQLIGEVKLPAEDVVDMLSKVLESASVAEKQKAINSLAVLQGSAGETLVNTLLDQLVAGDLAPELSLDLLQVVDKMGSEAVKAKKAAYEASKPEGDVLAAYQESLFGGNMRKGGRLFFMDNSAQCIRCHAVKGYGGEVGPDLTYIADELSREQLLESLVDPNARLAPGYGTISITLQDDKEIVGTLMKESDQAIIVKVGEEDPQEIALTDIKTKQYLPSAMISMRDVLSKSEIRDLMSFLMLLKTDSKVDLQQLLQ
ncbi:MAG: HEAT repeat domain-containing protein [Saprospiraceae bacterium]|nr:HEAT repeat domain-containing protein [Saprospiraceae bacterium]